MINRTTRERRKLRVRYKIGKGSAQRPRVSVARSNRNIYVQAIDDVKGITMASASTLDAGFNKKGKPMELAESVGRTLGEELAKLKVGQAIFDRGLYNYHGRVKKVAEGVKSAGVQI